MSRHRTDLTKGTLLPSTWVNAIMEFLGTQASNFVLEQSTATQVRVVASADNGQVALAINGKWRYITATITASHPGGAAGTYDVFATASANDFSAADPADNTNYTFGLQILAQGSTPATAQYRKVGEVRWDGSAITALRQHVALGSGVAPVTPTASVASQSPLTAIGATGQTAPLMRGRIGADGSDVFQVKPSGGVLVGGDLDHDGTTVGFFGVTPAARAGATDDIKDALTAYGLLQGASATPLNLDGGALTIGNLTATGNVRLGDNAADTLGFFDVAGVAKRTGYGSGNQVGTKVALAANSTPNDILAVLSSLVADARSYGLIGA